MARILLTEDDAAVRTFVSRALQLDGHDVTTAEDGEEALNVLKNEGGEFDLLLTDVKMPIMDGIALTHHAARDWPTLPILIMTGYADQRERARGLEAIVLNIVTKPFSLADIRSAVSGALADKMAA
uniref:response regulator n=1 Tax=Pararhizobium sp. IMCC3301 TaxID=3067904 RepID=UPI002741A649|nr:response regulator [Pararhizobium sp. IMCC3301]